MAFRGSGGKPYGVNTSKMHVPKKRSTVSYVIRDEEEKLNRSGVNALRVDERARHLYSAGRDSIIRCWDISSPDDYKYVRSLEHHTDWVNDLVVCMGGDYIMSAASDITLKLWNTRRGACTSTLRQQQDYIKCLAYASQREQVASGSLDHSIYIWDIRTLTSLTSTNNKVTTSSLRGQRDSVYSIAMNETGSVLVAGGTDKVLHVWDPRTDEKIMKLKGHTDNVRALLLSHDGTTCVSGSSDGTVRLWSLGQQRCIETFRMHEEGIWTLAADDAFQTVYSGGRDKKVYAIELNQGVEGSLLFVEDAPVLCLTRDVCDVRESLWVATTESSITKWTFDPDACEEEEKERAMDCREEGRNTEKEMEVEKKVEEKEEEEVKKTGEEKKKGEEDGEEEEEEEEESMEVTDIDEYAPSCAMRKTVHIPGGPSIREYRILEDRQHIITRDSNGDVQLWDVLHAVKEADLGQVDLEDEVIKRKSSLFIPNWFSVEIKTGMLTIRLSENDCFSAWIMGANVKLDTATPDLKLNLGALQLRALFEHWPSARPMVSTSDDVTLRGDREEEEEEAEEEREREEEEEREKEKEKEEEREKKQVENGELEDVASEKKREEVKEEGGGGGKKKEEEKEEEKEDKEEEADEAMERGEEGRGSEEVVEESRQEKEDGGVEKKKEEEEKIENSLHKQKTTTNKNKNVVPLPPKLEQLMSECEGVEQWVEFGAALHMPQSELDEIEHSHGDDPARCKRELFKLWLKITGDASWNSIVKALDHSSHQELSERIREKYLTRSASMTPPTSPSPVPPPPSPVVPPPSSSLNGANTDRVNIKFFSVPLHTPVILGESGDCATTLVRMLCQDAGGVMETRQLNNYCPIWVMDIVCQRKLPDHPKMNFSVAKYVSGQGTKDRKSSKGVDRLSAQDVITVKKLLEYIYSKIEPKTESSGSASANDNSGSKSLEMLCQDQVLDQDLDLRTVKYRYWKSGGDMRIYYREAQKLKEEKVEKEEEEEREEEEKEEVRKEGKEEDKKEEEEGKEEEEEEMEQEADQQQTTRHDNT